jgi:GNAT superfamily N-acetyltransferase
VPEPQPDPKPALRIERVPYGHPDAQLLVEEVQAEYVRRYGGRDETPIDSTAFDPPQGAFFVGYLVLGEGADLPVATGAWRLRSDVEALGSRRTAEGKRMYVVASARRAGHARTMLDHMERTAAEAGAEVMILETGAPQPEGIALYESSGYLRIPGFGHYASFDDNRCFARRLDDVRLP